jgi:aldehyde:ferredoxin oxidoreductase
MIAMLKKTLNREGFGDILADGSAKAADRLGKGHEYLLTVKGQELPAHMPHVKRSLGVIYATNPFGADHQSSEHDPVYHPKLYERLTRVPGPDWPAQTRSIPRPSTRKSRVCPEDAVQLQRRRHGQRLPVCLRPRLAAVRPARYGRPDERRHRLGRDRRGNSGHRPRRLNLMRAYNAREGLTRDQDTLPKKLFSKALEGGRSETGIRVQILRQ